MPDPGRCCSLDHRGRAFLETLTEKGNALTMKLWKKLWQMSVRQKVERGENDDPWYYQTPSIYIFHWKDGAGKPWAFQFSPVYGRNCHKPCLASCGTCTFMYPTCQCYDIKDYDTQGTVFVTPLLLGFLHALILP